MGQLKESLLSQLKVSLMCQFVSLMCQLSVSLLYQLKMTQISHLEVPLMSQLKVSLIGQLYMSPMRQLTVLLMGQLNVSLICQLIVSLMCLLNVTLMCQLTNRSCTKFNPSLQEPVSTIVYCASSRRPNGPLIVYGTCPKWPFFSIRLICLSKYIPAIPIIEKSVKRPLVSICNLVCLTLLNPRIFRITKQPNCPQSTTCSAPLHQCIF